MVLVHHAPLVTLSRFDLTVYNARCEKETAKREFGRRSDKRALVQRQTFCDNTEKMCKYVTDYC